MSVSMLCSQSGGVDWGGRCGKRTFGGGSPGRGQIFFSSVGIEAGLAQARLRSSLWATIVDWRFKGGNTGQLGGVACDLGEESGGKKI